MEAPVALPAADPKPPRLSPRESEVIALLAAGHSYKSAADALGVRIDTVRFHVRAAYAKLRTASGLQISIIRRGQPMTIDYSIRQETVPP